MTKQVVLINPPLAKYDFAELAPPLSLLTLAAAAQRRGFEPTILDLNLPQYRDWFDDTQSGLERCLEVIRSMRPDVVGLTSMGVNSHLAILLGQIIREQIGIRIVLGGAHLTSIRKWVQAIAPDLEIDLGPRRRNSMEDTPFPWGAELPEGTAQDLFRGVPWHEYMSANPRRLANLSAGGGCKYKCSFCYSPPFHGGWYTRDPFDVARDMRHLADVGVEHVFIVDDNLLNSADWFMRFATTLASDGPRLSWNGYATLADLTMESIKAAGGAGCRDLFVGVDTTEPEQQRSWRKSSYKGFDKLEGALRCAHETGTNLTCAFILDLRERAHIALVQNLECAIRVSRAGGMVRLSVLTPYPSTELSAGSSCEDNIYSETRTSVLMDLPRAVVENSLARRWPRAFPWHVRPKACSTWDVDIVAVAVAQHLLNKVQLSHEGGELECGEVLWSRCRDVAEEVMKRDTLHKTELRAAYDSSLEAMSRHRKEAVQ